MGAMSQLAAEKDAEINHLHATWLEEFEKLRSLLEKYPLGRRTYESSEEVAKQDAACGIAKYKYEAAESQRYKVT